MRAPRLPPYESVALGPASRSRARPRMGVRSLGAAHRATYARRQSTLIPRAQDGAPSARGFLFWAQPPGSRPVLRSATWWPFCRIRSQKAIPVEHGVRGPGAWGCGFGPLTRHYFPHRLGAFPCNFPAPGPRPSAVFPRLRAPGGTRRKLASTSGSTSRWSVLNVFARPSFATAARRGAAIVPGMGRARPALVGPADRTSSWALNGAEHYCTNAGLALRVRGATGSPAPRAVQIAAWVRAGSSSLNSPLPPPWCADDQ